MSHDGSRVRGHVAELTHVNPSDVREKRVATCAEMRSLGQWRGRPTVKVLAEEWGVARETVWAYDREAARLIRADRGTLMAQAEQSIAECLTRRDELLASATARRAEAEELLVRVRKVELSPKADPKSAIAAAIDRKNALQLYKQATADEKEARAWHEHKDLIAGIKTNSPGPAMQAREALAHPAVQALLEGMAQILEKHPGAQEEADAMLAQLENGSAPVVLHETEGMWHR